MLAYHLFFKFWQPFWFLYFFFSLNFLSLERLQILHRHIVVNVSLVNFIYTYMVK